MLDSVPLLLAHGRELGGRTYNNAQAIYALRADPQPDGSYKLVRATFDNTQTNGILVSPDQRTLYVAESSYKRGVNRELRAYLIKEDGSLGTYDTLFSWGEDARGVLPSARSVIVTATLYNTSQPFSLSAPASGRAWVSRYAWGDDYHQVLMRRLDALVAWMHEAHHAAKKDAPSGTALMLKTAMEQAGYDRPIDMSSARAGSAAGSGKIAWMSTTAGLGW